MAPDAQCMWHDCVLVVLIAGGVYCNGGQGIAVVNTVIYEPGGTVVIVDTGTAHPCSLCI